jgi:RNAse (barnase) inhibitor barstar
MVMRDGGTTALARLCVCVALIAGTCEAAARVRDVRPPSPPEVTSLCEPGRELSKVVAKPAFEINGARFTDLEGFYDEVEAALIPDAMWGRNLNAFNDILRGGFGTPDGGFVLVWKHHKLSRERLGRQYTLRSMK